MVGYLKILGVMFAVAGLALAWKDATTIAPDPDKESRRIEQQAARIRNCLSMPGDVDITIDSFGDFAGCTVKAKRIAP